MNSQKPGILFLNGVLPPPYGGIAHHLKTYLPLLVQEGYKVWTVMERSYASHNYDEYQARGVNILIPRDPPHARRPYYYRRRLTLYSRYARWMMRRYVHHRSSYRSVEEQLLSYLPETDDLLRWHQHEIDIIHVFDRPWRQGWIGQILAEKYRKRLIISVFGEVLPHDDPIELIDAASEPYRSLSQDVLQRADRLASMTRSCAERVALLSLNPSTVYPLYFVSGMEEFIEPPAIDLYPHFPELKGKRIVLFVGQLQPRKGPDVLLRAMPGVIERFPDVVVVIVGADYGMHADLEALAAYLGVETSCVFTGPVPQDTLKALYKAATVFAFTTVSQIECLGLVFVQAMYARCAVVASDISGVPEVIRHGENGLLYPPGDAAALQNHIITLLGDPTLRQHLSAQAFADVNHQFAPAGLRDQIAALYSFDD